MVKKVGAKDVKLSEKQANAQDRDYKRMDTAADKYGLTVPFFKKLINEGKLTRYKLGAATLIDCRQLERLITPDVGNHGPDAAPKAAHR